MSLRHYYIPIFTILLLALPLSQAIAQSTQQKEVVDEIAAVVEGEVILRSEVDQYVLSMMQQQQRQFSEDLWMETLNELINQQLLAAEAERDTNIQVSEQEVEGALDRQVNQLVSQAGSEQALEDAYGRSVLQLREDFREHLRTQMLAQRLQEQELGNLRITPSEVRQWFEQIPEHELPELPTVVRLSHIVRYPEVSETAKADARDMIESIRDSIVVRGAEFEEMARQFSDDPGSAQRGGRIAGAHLDDLYPEFAAVAARIPEGEVSQPFETPLGFHILRVNSRSGSTVDFNHILIRIDESSADPQSAIDHLEAVRDSIVNHGMPFARMAREHSQESRSAENSGRVTDPQSGTRDLVYDALDPTWQETIDQLEEGEISEPRRVQLLDGREGYHIVKLHRRTPAHRMNLDEDYDRIEQYALQEKRHREMQEWVAELREESYVDVRVDPENIELMFR